MTKKKKKGKRYGLASGKTTTQRKPKPKEEGAMLAWLKREVYDYTYPFENVDTRSEKEVCSEEIATMLRENYKEYRIINTINMEYTPEDRIWLNYPICITREEIGITLIRFLTYARGNNFVNQSDAITISAKAGIEPRKIDEVCKYLVNYLSGEIREKHKRECREPRVRPGNGAPIYNYHVDASSGATVNIY